MIREWATLSPYHSAPASNYLLVTCPDDKLGGGVVVAVGSDAMLGSGGMEGERETRRDRDKETDRDEVRLKARQGKEREKETDVEMDR